MFIDQLHNHFTSGILIHPPLSNRVIPKYFSSLFWAFRVISKRPVTRSFDFFIWACTNSWANNGDAGDLRRHGAHYDVIVMYCEIALKWMP